MVIALADASDTEASIVFVTTLALGSRPRQRGCKVAGQKEGSPGIKTKASGAGQEEVGESHHILLGV